MHALIGHHEHILCLPVAKDRPPIADEILQQLLREVAEAIYLHDQLPDFDSSINHEGKSYPILHPVYQHTLVGKIMRNLRAAAETLTLDPRVREDDTLGDDTSLFQLKFTQKRYLNFDK